MGLAEDLATLGDLYERGVIDRQQFEQAKARLLGDGGEVSTEGVASEDMPTAEPPGDAEALVGSSRSPSLDSAEHAARADESETDDCDDATPAEAPELASRSLWEQVKNNPKVLVAGGLAIVAALVGLSVFAPPSEFELRREEARRDITGQPYGTDHFAERAFIDEYRARMPHNDHVLNARLLEWGYEGCAFLDYHQPRNGIELGVINLWLNRELQVFEDDDHLDRHLMSVAVASWTLCDEYGYLYSNGLDEMVGSRRGSE